jgi:poly-gamma-glutamate capsule biosynthesis protein CapA/YwtB (metallophosphatase superfamily)
MKRRHLRLAFGLAGLGLMLACSPEVAISTALPATFTAVPAADTGTPAVPPPTITPSVEPDSTASPAPSATPEPTQSTIVEPPTETPPAVFEFMAVGDLMLGRTVGERILASGHEIVFSQVAAELLQADLLAGNLECVITDVGKPQPKSFTFRAPPAAAEALAEVGFDVVGLANNHALDYGIDGLADMLARLRVSGIAASGAGVDAAAARSPVILVRNGVRVGFLSYVNVPVEGRTGFDTRSWAADDHTPGLAWGEPQAITTDVQNARALADVVIVMLHVGHEGRAEVIPLQAELAHAAIDAGAALVVGAHSHVLQGVERYGGGLIAYGLGNFVFDGFAIPSNYSAIFSATISLHGVESHKWIPVVVDHGLPRLATEAEAAQILPRVEE